MSMRVLFIDATASLAAVAERLHEAEDPPLEINIDAGAGPVDIPALIAASGADTILVDHSFLPTEVARRCPGLKHVVFLGTGARSYMNIEELAELGISVDIIKGYGDTAVAECTLALMMAAARGIARMDRGMRAGGWPRTEGMELKGKTLGLIGFGAIAAEVAHVAAFGLGMEVMAWNRTPKALGHVNFVELDELLAESHVVSLHLLLTDETRGFLSAERIARMRPGALLVNTARGALVDEAAMIAALKSGQIGHGAFDVFVTEPLPAGHPLTALDNVTLSAHSAFRTPEAADNLIGTALSICRARLIEED